MDEARRGKYADVCPETVARVFAEQAEKHKKAKDAEKAARAQLHAITGAFMPEGALRRARTWMRAYFEGDETALSQALCQHASTRERLPYADALFDRVFARAGTPGSVLDLACGLNPLYLAARGVGGVLGVDIHVGCVSLINECAEARGWDARARAGDLLVSPVPGAFDLALMMKLLPVLEAQKRGAARAALAGANARHILVTFPTRSLSGRNVGMEGHYSAWFESVVPGDLRPIDRFIMGNELAYLLERTNDGEIIRGGDADRQPERPVAPHGAGVE